MTKLNGQMRERKITDFRIIKLRTDLKAMAVHRESIQRSKDIKRIDKFNKLFVSKLGELSKLMQMHGFSNRDDAAELVRKMKAK
jgi:hypothetical protein